MVGLQRVWWKRVLPVQAPYRWNLRRLQPGFMLDIGCGIGRSLLHIDGNGVGVDHNAGSVACAQGRGLRAFTSTEFPRTEFARDGVFDSMLLSHVAEHMTRPELVELLMMYIPFVRIGGKVIVITPQEAGFDSDDSHIMFADWDAIGAAADEVGLVNLTSYSFPFPRVVGRVFLYNEFVWVGEVTEDCLQALAD